MAERSEKPSAANSLRKRLIQLGDHAITKRLRPDNPARGTKAYRTKGGGFHAWDEGEIARFFEVHGPGTTAHRAVSLLLYTGGFGDFMRKSCDKAGLPLCTAHGLRKACARRLAEAGCTIHEIAAVTGHKTLAEVQRYTESTLREAMAKLIARPNREQTVANLPGRFAGHSDKGMK